MYFKNVMCDGISALHSRIAFYFTFGRLGYCLFCMLDQDLWFFLRISSYLTLRRRFVRWDDTRIYCLWIPLVLICYYCFFIDRSVCVDPLTWFKNLQKRPLFTLPFTLTIWRFCPFFFCDPCLTSLNTSRHTHSGPIKNTRLIAVNFESITS